MLDELTNAQIALLCAIEEHDHGSSTNEQKRDLERLISEGYVQPTEDHPGSAFELTAKGAAVLGERGAGLNEA
jgi:CTP-dependent riboflavin kinase